MLTAYAVCCAAKFNGAALDQACAELEDLRKQLGDTEEDKPMSMNQLSVNLLRHSQPTQFEQQYLGWPVMACQKEGNPRTRKRPAEDASDESDMLD